MRELHRTRAVDRIFPLGEAAFFDELFHYLREIGAWPLLEQLDPCKREGAIYPFIQFVMLTIMRCVGGVQSMLAMHDLVLTDEALMSTVGFNAAQVQAGSTSRGLSRRTEPVAIRGALSYETVADNIVTIGRDRLEALFNGTIRSVALDRGFLDGKLLSAIERDGIHVYIPAKANLNVAKDAREIARRAAEQAARGRQLEGCVYRERQQTVTHGAGKNATREELTTTLVGIRDLPCDWWGEDGCTSKANSKSFKPKLLRATVVLRWDGAPKEAERRGQDTGIARYRRQLEVATRDKVAIFIGERFGILRNWEFALLGGVSVREREIMGETAQSVLRRFGIDPPEPGS